MMKIINLPILLVAILAVIGPVQAQDNEAQTIEALKQIQTQQERIAANETKLESKVADLTETLRVARIFTSRLGGAHKPPKAPK